MCQSLIYISSIEKFMPALPPTYCPGFGPRTGCCGNTIQRGVRCCPDCKPYRSATLASAHERYDRKRGTAKERGYGPTWARVRRLKLNRNPLCERCNSVANMVHHKDRDSRNNLEANLEALCNQCHAREHAMDHETDRRLRSWDGFDKRG